MRKIKSILFFIPLSLSCVGLLSGCDEKEDIKVIRVLNCEDYIYEYEEGDEEYATEGEYWYTEDVMEQFVEYWADTHDGEEIDYVYDTFDTNETMFNELATGKTSYDVIVPSDYMIQKLISNDMLHKISEENKEELWENISPFLNKKFNTITAPLNGKDEKLADYALPYMWGTVGLMYNPKFYTDANPGLTEDDVHALFKDWDSLYTSDVIRGTFSIKDSVRDTYAVSLIHYYRDEIAGDEISEEKLGEIFNRNSAEEMAEIKLDMLDLKAAAFGFECDSGKTDMVDQKVGANVCWSGDATWAITEARGDGEEDELSLYYSVPTSYNDVEYKGASNMWLDGLCMPKTAADENNLTEEEKAQYDLAEEFMKFISTPEIAVQNCYCVGYTPGVAGEAMFDYMLDSYDISNDLDEESVEGEDYVKYNLTYFFKDSLSSEYLADLGLDNDYIYITADPDTAKRELAAQYPEEKELPRLAVMKDFGTDGNARLLDMWEQVRTNSLPTWAIIVLAIECAGGIAFAVYLVSHTVNRKRFKKERQN